MALTNRKRRQLGEIGDNFEVPDEAYCRAARFLGQSLSYRPWGIRRLHGPPCSGNQHFRAFLQSASDV